MGAPHSNADVEPNIGHRAAKQANTLACKEQFFFLEIAVYTYSQTKKGGEGEENQG